MVSDPLIDPAEFVAAVQPLLQAKDMHGLIALLKTRYTHEQITSLFTCANPDARKVAALAFGLVGRKCCLPKLTPLLKDPDAVVNQMAEHAMWSVWFRSGTREANCEMKCGTRALDRREFAKALDYFTRAIDADPTFAEAYNQRAIVHYLQERWAESIEDYRRTVERMPCHFGAWAGMGHSHAHEGQAAEAIACYERALAINPHLDCVRQAVDALRGDPSAGDGHADC